MFLGSSLTYAIISSITPTQQEIPWQAALFVVIFEDPVEIPAGVGVENETRAKLYTLNYDNIIYKEGEEDSTLRDFFEIWGETFNSTCILDYCNNANNSIRMYVNNRETLDYEYYVIRDRDVIVIDYR